MGEGLDRRRFLLAAAALLAAPLVGRGVARAAEEPASGLDAGTRRLLRESPFVYVSPLLGDGSESTCHGEVWYAWLDGAVHLVTSTQSWKARAARRGLSRARIWVGDHGRWKVGPLRNDDFRKAPSFEARVERSRDPELLDRMMVRYRERYPDEIRTWEPRFREALASGERVILRYEPVV